MLCKRDVLNEEREVGSVLNWEREMKLGFRRDILNEEGEVRLDFAKEAFLLKNKRLGWTLPKKCFDCRTRCEV